MDERKEVEGGAISSGQVRSSLDKNLDGFRVITIKRPKKVQFRVRRRKKSWKDERGSNGCPQAGSRCLIKQNMQEVTLI